MEKQVMLPALEPDNNDHLLFSIEGITFSVETSQVVAIIEPPLITHLPVMPDYVKGGFSFREHAAVAVDTRLLLRLQVTDRPPRSAYIVTHIDSEAVAFEVDRVLGISAVDNMQAAPEFFSQAGINIYNVEKYGMAISVSFDQLVASENNFASDEWQRVLRKQTATGNKEVVAQAEAGDELPGPEGVQSVAGEENDLPAQAVEDVDDDYRDIYEMAINALDEGETAESHDVEQDLSNEIVNTSSPDLSDEAERETSGAAIEDLAAEKLEAERLVAEKLEAEKLEAEKLEAEKLEAEKLEAEKLEAEKLEAEKLEAEKLEAERLETERLETESLESTAGITDTGFVSSGGQVHVAGKDKRKFREIRLSNKAKNIFASQKKGPVFYLGLVGLISLLVVAWIGFSNGLIVDRSLAERTSENNSGIESNVQSAPLVEDISKASIMSEPVFQGAIGSVVESVVENAEKVEIAEVTRIVNIETPEFSITVDRPLVAGAAKKGAGLVLDLSVKDASDAESAGLEVSTTRYEVHRGDTLWAIAKNMLENPFLYPELAENNGIKNPDLIFPGDVVTVIRRIAP